MRRWSLVLSASFAMSACFYDWDRPEAADAGTDANVSRDAGSDGGFTKDASSTDSGGTCSKASPCPVGSYCRYSDHACGTGETTGRCTTVPSCPKPGTASLYCGCDGTLYDSDCNTFAGGVDVNATGSTCKADTLKYFTCGYAFCPRDSTYCVATGNEYACEVYPGTCTKADCTCAQQGTKCGKCTSDGSGGVTLSCP